MKWGNIYIQTWLFVWFAIVGSWRRFRSSFFSTPFRFPPYVARVSVSRGLANVYKVILQALKLDSLSCQGLDKTEKQQQQLLRVSRLRGHWIEWMNEWLTNYKWMNINIWRKEGRKKWRKEWMDWCRDEWRNEWRNERTNEQTMEWINESWSTWRMTIRLCNFFLFLLLLCPNFFRIKLN